jgi:FdhD protein
MAFVSSVTILQHNLSGRKEKPDLLAMEEPLEIRIGFGLMTDRQQKSLSVTMRTPGYDFELAIGFLFTEGIIQHIDQIESVKYCEDIGKQEEKGNVVRVELKPEVQIDFEKLQRHFYTSSSCGVCGKSSIESVKVLCQPLGEGFSISASLIHQLPDTLRKAQAVFEYTGGLHAVGLFDKSGELILLREDVGRHNALDKAIGAMVIKKQVPLSDYALLVSGRASFELVQKAAVAGIPVLAAVGAPSSLAVALAKESGMTLLGFVRQERFNIYCGDQRITSIG